MYLMHINRSYSAYRSLWLEKLHSIEVCDSKNGILSKFITQKIAYYRSLWLKKLRFIEVFTYLCSDSKNADMDVRKLITVFSDQKEELESNELSTLCDRLEEAQISLSSKLAQVVIGVRRSGKSTLCEKVLRQEHVSFAYANFDDDRLTSLTTEDFDSILDALYQLYGDFRYLFLDEVQNVEGWQLFVNRMLRQNIHLVITGSNAKLLSGELTTHLTGRYHKIELFPFSFTERARMKDVDLSSLSVRAVALRKKALNEYLIEGGFPELLSESDKRGYVEGLLDAIIRNDIAQRFRVRYVEVLRRLASYLMDNFCQEYSAKELSTVFGVSDHTIDNYYGYLKEAFLFMGIHKFSYKSKERILNEKVYVVDPAFVTDRNDVIASTNLGWRLENVVYIELLRRYRPQHKDIFYYRDRQWEVDFMVVKDGTVEQLIQVSYDISSDKTRQRELNALVKASEKFHCDDLLLINMDNEEQMTVKGHRISVVTAAEWLVGKH